MLCAPYKELIEDDGALSYFMRTLFTGFLKTVCFVRKDFPQNDENKLEGHRPSIITAPLLNTLTHLYVTSSPITIKKHCPECPNYPSAHSLCFFLHLRLQHIQTIFVENPRKMKNFKSSSYSAGRELEKVHNAPSFQRN